MNDNWTVLKTYTSHVYSECNTVQKNVSAWAQSEEIEQTTKPSDALGTYILHDSKSQQLSITSLDLGRRKMTINTEEKISSNLLAERSR